MHETTLLITYRLISIISADEVRCLLQLLTAALILKANGIDAFHQPAKVKAQVAACDRTEEANTVYLCQRSPQGLFLLQHGTNCLKLFELARFKRSQPEQ